MKRHATALTAIAFIGMGMTAWSGRSARETDIEAEGRWVGSGPEYLTLVDGELRGSDGCNGVAGTYTRDGETLTFHRGMSTLKACVGVDTWLRGAARATIRGEVMTVLDREGNEIGILTRDE